MRKLKLFFACLLMAVLSIGQVWGTSATWTLVESAPSDWSGEYLIVYGVYCFNGSLTSSFNGSSGQSFSISTDGKSITLDDQYAMIVGDKSSSTYSLKTASGYYLGRQSSSSNGVDANTSYTSSTLGVSFGSWNSTNKTVKIAGVGGKCLGSNSNSWNFFASSNAYVNVKMYRKESGSVSTPTLTIKQGTTAIETLAIPVAGATNQTLTVAYANIKSGTTPGTPTLAYYSNAACTSTTSKPSWLTSVTATNGTTITYSAAANTTDAARTPVWMVVSNTVKNTSNANATVTDTLKITQAAPTGTFKLFSGDLTAGKYVICDGTNAMKNTATSAPRIEAATVSVNAENKIVNPDAAVIWNVEFLTGDDVDYFTLYNEAASKYAAFTSTNARGTLVDAVSNYAKWQYSENEFSNKGLTGKYLRFNNGYGFASYATTTGNELTLYKLDDGTPNPPTFSPAGGSFLEAQSVTLSAEAGAEIYYTMGENPADPTSGSTHYTGAIAVSSTTTIKAVAIKDDKSSNVASAIYTIWDEPLSVAAAIALIPNANDQVNDQFVEGYVCTAGTSVSSGKMTYYISADGSETNRLQIYKGKNLDDTEFSAVGDLAVGDKVVVFGQLKNYGGTPEMNDGNYIVRRTAKGALSSVVVSGTPTKTVYANNEAFEPAGLVVTATYASGYAIEVTPTSWSATPSTITANGNVEVTATFGGMTSGVYNVAVTKASKTLVSIAVDEDQFEQWQGLELPKPTVTATYSEGDPEDVTSQAEFTGYDASTTGDQEITVSYTFGGETKYANYTVTVKSIYNVELAASVARNLIVNVVGNTESTDDMIVRGKVSYINNASSNAQTYWISDDGTRTNEVEIYKGKYLSGADFTSANQLRVGDEVVVIGKVINYNNNTPEFANGKSEVQSHVRTPNFAITDVTALEVGATDLAVADLTINVEGEGAITLVSGDETKATIVSNAIHAVAPGPVTITANLAADGIYKAATTTFNVTVIAATVKYAISFDGNGADGGSAPTAIADKAEGAEVTLPANTYTKTNKLFDGWKVINNSTSAEIAVTAGAFTMPASAVTIQAQWAEIPVWAYTYTSNVTTSAPDSKVIPEDAEEYDAWKIAKAGSITLTVPAGTTVLHFHLVAWKGEGGDVTISGDCFTLDKVITAVTNDGISNSSPFTLSGEGVRGSDFYYSLTPDNAITENTVITFTTASGKRAVVFGVNAIYPEITLDPASVAFGNVRANQTKSQEFTITTNENVSGTLNASIINENVSGKFSVGSISAGKVTVTFDPDGATSGDFTAKLKVWANNAEVTADLSGTAIAAETPEIVVDKNAIAFDRVDPNAEVSETISVELLHITGAVSATLEGTNTDKFTLSTTSLSANGNIVVTPNTTANGIFSATLKLTAAGADDVEIPLSITVANKWAVTYTSNVDIASNESKQVTIAGTDYDAAKSNKGTTATITLPQGVTTIHLHLVAWKDEAQTVSVTGACFNEAKELAIAANDAVSGSAAKYDLGASGIDYYFSLTPDNAVAANEVITITAASGKRFVLFGVNQEGGIYGTYTRTVSGNYGTICLPKAGVLTNGTLFEIAYYGQTSKKIFFDEILNNEMVAGRPYLFKPNDGVTELRVNYTDNADPVAAGNWKGLHGFYNLADENATFNIPQDAGNYIMYSNQYWEVSGRAAYIENYRAYIVLSDITTIEPAKAPGTRRVSLNVNGEQTATDIDALNAEETPVKVMINGQLFILRGEKLYDATGRLVK